MTDKLSRTARRTQKTQKTPKKKRPIWKTILLTILFLGVATGIVLGSVAIYWITTAPELDPDQLDVPLTTTLYDKFGEPFAKLEVENRELVKFEELPQVLIDAVTATEDARFFEHHGIDWKRLGGAIVANITDGFGSQGASTITHQVVENFFLSNEKKLKLKVQEQWLALKLERMFSKEEILEMYLNKIFYGQNAYGVKAAAKTYFGIDDLHDLSLPQAAILAGLPQRPTAYNPFRNPELTAERMDTVLKLMVRHGKITEEEAEEARQVDITALLDETSQNSIPHGAFIDQVETEIQNKLEDVNIYTDGLKIYTTIDTSIQERVEFLLTDSEENPINFGHEDVQGAIVVLETRTGAIQAIGGQRNTTLKGQLNYATEKYPPGSTIKPIIDYGPAIEYNQLSTYYQLNDDAPYTVGDHTFNNVTRRYSGWVTMRKALRESLNVPAVKMLEEVGFDRAMEFGEKLGLDMPEFLVHSDAIGGGKLEVSPLELAGAFRVFGNEGIYNEPYAVTSVEFQDGSTVDLRPDSKAVIHDYTAYMITDMLKDVFTQGTWAAGSMGGLPVAGKTGTTNLEDGSAPERWFVGYTTNYTITTFVGGYEVDHKRAGLPDTVHWTLPQQMFRETMLPISEGIETPDFPKPNSVVEVVVERGTNPPELASEYTPQDQKLRELFVRGTEPTKVSEKYDQLDPVTGLAATFDEETNTISVEWDYDTERDVSFEISASVDDGAMKELSTTEDTSITISEVEPGATYTIQVVVVSNESSSLKSEPVTTKVTVPEEEEEEEEELEEEENGQDENEGENIPPVSGLSAEYISSQGIIDVNWTYNGPPAVFEVLVNGIHSQTVQSQGIEISGNFSPGETYTISVTSIGQRGANRGVTGETQTTTVVIPDETPPDDETSGDVDE